MSCIPKILLSTADLPADNYLNAVKEAGGEGIARYLPAYEGSYDGLVLCGGGDVHPRYYGEQIKGSADIDEERDKAEFALVKAFLNAGKPILGICRGCQLLNVYFGGDLYQHLDNAACHSSFSGYDLTHPVSSAKGSILNGLYGDTFTVNSYHHQAVRKLGKDLIPTVFCDSVIEAAEHESLPVLGVQFHPERMGEGAKIFGRFIAICRHL